VAAIKAPCLKVIHVDSERVRGDDLAAEAELFKNKAIAILLDTKTATAKGGSGVVFDWNVVNTLDFPVSINNFYL